MAEIREGETLRQVLDELNTSNGINNTASFQSLISHTKKSATKNVSDWIRLNIPQQNLRVPTISASPVQTPIGSPSASGSACRRDPINPEEIEIDLDRVTNERKSSKMEEGPYGVTDLSEFISKIKKAEAKRGNKIDVSGLTKKADKVKFLREYYNLPPEVMKEKPEKEEKEKPKKEKAKR